jgi:hypothetical protein
MILAENYEDVLRSLGRDYFIQELQFVPNLAAWAEKQLVTLHEPYQLMKLVPSGAMLTMVIQSEVPETMLDDLITGLGVRWSRINNLTDSEKKLNSVKKRLVFSFLKEYSRSLSELRDDELLQDDWTLKAMERLGFFRE